MNCSEFEREWVALDDVAQLSPGMEQHRGECSRCAGLADDLKAILTAAQSVGAVAEPPPRVWASLRNQLEIEGLIHASAPAGKAARSAAAPAGWGWLRVPMGLAYGAVFFVALSVVYLYNEATNPGTQPPPAGTPSVPGMAWVRPDTAEQDKNVDDLLARIPEEQRATFVSNWNQVNSSIENLQSFVEANPNDPFAAEMLKNSLQQKEYLRGTLVGWEGF
jgi:hypothetical protein